MNTIESQDRISVICRRDIERKLNIQKQKDIKELSSSKTESIDFFDQEFSRRCSEIENLLDSSTTLPVEKLPDHLNGIFKELLILQKYVAASNLFLRTYDVKKCNETLNILTNRAKELEDELMPKKKFGFKNKKKLTNNVPSLGNGKGRDEIDFKVSKKLSNNENSSGVSEKTDGTFYLNEEEVSKKDVTVHHLTNCTVRIEGAPSTLHLDTLNGCTLLCGPVSTSIFASNCENCTLVIACQQLRLHSSKDVEIYLHVTSRAIMEDCVNISVAPFNFEYEAIDKHFDQSGLDKLINNWQCIDDFNWLNTNQHSPNWKVLEESRRREKWS